MNDDLFEGKFAEGDYYPGIYNYCDRWCERCRFNSRCLNYSIEQEFNEKHPGDEIEDTVERIKLIFEEISSMLEKFMEQEGIDIDELPEIDENAEKEVEKKVDENYICNLANAYTENVHEWFSANNDILEKFVIHLRENVESEFAEGDPLDDILSLHDVIDIIIYYHTFIYVKLRRAVRDKFDDIFDEEFKELDQNISVKLALIGIDRSIDSWRIMNEIISDNTGLNVENFILQLEMLRETLEKEFPNARSFVRPYFDEEEL